MNDPETESTGAEAAPSPAPKRSDYKSDRTFADFPISPAALQALGEMNYVHATPVQAAAIEPALAGKDLIVRAKTGTGKTTAFGLPMIERVEEGARTTQALVLTPTRELAVQVAQEVALLAKYRDVRITAIYGGVGFPPQEEALNAGSEIVVGTPGRLLDHIRRGNLKLAQVKVVVLDEADEMLSMGFFEDVRKIVAACAPERQTMLFSATLDESLRGFANSYMKNPEDLHLSADGDNVHLIQHFLYETSPDYHKARALLDLIELERPHSAIIFCNTREDVSTVYTYLDRQGRRRPVPGQHRCGRARHRHQQPLARHPLRTPGGRFGVPPPLRPHGPHRQRRHGDRARRWDGLLHPPHPRASAQDQVRAEGAAHRRGEREAPHRPLRAHGERSLGHDGVRLDARCGARDQAAPRRRHAHRRGAQGLHGLGPQA
jgi:hypothetical protein